MRAQHRRAAVRAAALALTVARAAAGLAVAWRLTQGACRRPPLRSPRAPRRGRRPDVTVIVPARNERGRLGPCLEALRDDPDVGEVVVVDDESDDGTAALAEGLGARVVTGRPLPPGWVGKPWALQQGLEAASGDWVLCLDADTRARRGLTAALLAAADDTESDLVTAAARFVCDGAPLQALHAAMLATLLYRFPPPGAGRQGPPHRRIGNGQCLLAPRERLAAAGGFALAGSHLTDDIALVRALAARGWRTAFLDATPLLDVRMHDGAADAWRSWGRSLPMADATTPLWRCLDLATLWLAMALPGLRVLSGRGDRLDAGLLALRLAVVVATAGAYAPPRRGLWLAPLADAAVVARLTVGTVRPGRVWRGRRYPTRR